MWEKMISRTRAGSGLVLVVVLVSFLAACTDNAPSQTSNSGSAGSSNSASLDCSPTAPPSAKANLPIEAGSIGQIAADISKDAGKVIAAVNGSPERQIIVFEETHTSRVGQLEIALMLVRLHDKHNLRQISLEGAIADRGELPAKPFHSLPVSQSAPQAKERVALRLLREGEISSAEFMALALPDMRVKGSERAEEYDVKPSNEASGAPLRYLLAIAEKSLTQDQIQEANRLMAQNKREEAINALFRADPWIRERYEKLTDRSGNISAEELIGIYREIENKAGAVSARINSEMKAGLQENMKFFQTASQRSCTMVRNTLAMCDAAPKSPVGMIIGAAHTTKVAELLRASKVSFAIISPSSLVDHSEHGALTLLAYERKLDQKSVDTPGLLGAYLSNRRKPTTVLGKQWLKSKWQIYYAATLIADAAGSGERPPFSKLAKQLKELDAITIDPSSYAEIKVGTQSRLMFKVTALTSDTDPNQKVDLWMGIKPPGPPNDNPPGFAGFADDEGKRPTSLEMQLEEELKAARQEAEPTQTKTEPQPQEPPRLQISKKLEAVISTDQAAVKKAISSI